DEADQLAHDIVVIDHGKVIATGTPDELKSKTGGQVLQVSPADHARLDRVAAVLEDRTGTEPATAAESGLGRGPVADAALLPVIIRDLDEAGVELAEFTLRKSSLDEVFFALTGGDPARPGDAPGAERAELERNPR